MVSRILGFSVLVLLAVLSGCSQTTDGLTPEPEPGSTTVAWRSVDIGLVGAQGESGADEDATEMVVQGAGDDIWGTSDSFHFTYRLATGDAVITARVRSVEAIDDWTKAGLMFRASEEPGARHAFVLMTPENGSDMQARTMSDGDTLEPGYDPSPRPPYWLRLEREGDTLTGYQSADGSSWMRLGTVRVDLPETAMVGLAVTSGLPGELASAQFTDVSIEGEGVDGAIPVPTPIPPPPTGDVQTVRYEVDTTDFRNPERGWYAEGGPSAYDRVYDTGFTLAMRYVRLDDYRYGALSSSFLDSLRSEFASVRDSGVKLVLRFAYNRSMAADAPIDVVLQHISQLEPVLREYADVIAVVQAGFIGAWGEWHSSTNDLTSFSNRSAILDALTDALPESRMIGVRTPYLASDVYPNPPTASTAFSGTDASRVGQKNDCFLTSESDTGTYRNEDDRAYTRQVSTYTATGGETCDAAGLTARNDGASAIRELTDYHWDYLHAYYWTAIYDKWRDQGYYDEISRRLGYRLVLEQATAPTTLAPGSSIGMSIAMSNVGFGKVYNPRPIDLVFVPAGGGDNVRVRVTEDARRMLPLAGESTTIEVNAALPAGTPSGAYEVFLALPDASPNLQGDPRYSIRLANSGTWVASNGYNDLRMVVFVD